MTTLDAMLALATGAPPPDAGPATASLPPNSRYFGTPTATLHREDGTPEGRTIVYLRRRFIPPPERFALLQEHVVADGERPDTLAARYLEDPEQFWRICDANLVVDPNDLTDTPGRVVRITLPAGIPAPAPEP
jgi:hypothetical protein